MSDESDCIDWNPTIEKAPIGVFRTTPGGKFKYANQKLARIFGFSSPAELMAEVTDLGKQLLLKPSQRDEVKAILEESGQVDNFIYEARARDKTLRYLSFSARVVNEDSGTLYYEGFMHDITEQKIAELRLKTILKEIQGMAYRCKPVAPWDMEWVSDGCRELTGYNKEDLEKQRPVYGDLIWETHVKHVSQIVEKAIETNTTFTLVYPIRTSNNEKKWVFERGRAVRDENNKVVCLEGVVQNYNEDRDWYRRERLEIENNNERQNQFLRRAMWWTIIIQFIVANLVILGIVVAKGIDGSMTNETLAAFFGATVAELAAIIFVIVKYVFPSKREGAWTDSNKKEPTKEAIVKLDSDGTAEPYPDDFRSDDEPAEDKPKGRKVKK